MIYGQREILEKLQNSQTSTGKRCLSVNDIDRDASLPNASVHTGFQFQPPFCVLIFYLFILVAKKLILDVEDDR